MFHKLTDSQPNRPAPQVNNGYAGETLLSRIANQATYATYVEKETDFPLATGTVSAPGEVGRADAVAEIPLSVIGIYPGVASYKSDMPLITTDGAPVKASGPGSWGQLYAAGRMP